MIGWEGENRLFRSFVVIRDGPLLVLDEIHPDEIIINQTLTS